MTAEDNKALVRRWFTELDCNNFAVIEELIPEDYINHNPAIGGLGTGREGIRAYIDMLRHALPDTVHTIEDQMAEGDKVMTRLTARGTFQRAILGYEPTGRLVTISGIAVHRIAHGQLVEHWAHLDMAGFIEQLGDKGEGEPIH